MKQKFGKRLNPTALQGRILSNLSQYQQKLEASALNSAVNATETISSCCVCGEKKSRQFISVYSFEYVQCPRCSHVYLSHRLSETSMQQFYAENQDYASSYTNQAQLDYRLKHVAMPKIKFVMEHINRSNKNKNWLDVGCAIGDILKAVEKYDGWQGIGLDISHDSVKLGRDRYGVDLRRQQLSEFSKENPISRFDVISFFGYLGLVADPMADLTRARNHVRKGGYIVIGEENADSFSTLLQQSFPKHSTRHLLPPMTTNQFTTDSIEYALGKINCEVIATWNFGLDFYELIKMMTLAEPTFDQSPAFLWLTENLNSLQKVIDKKNRGDYIIVVAKAR